MKLISPDADEVFNRFIQNAPQKKIHKFFGGILRSAITAAESVKEVERSAMFFFKTKVDPKGYQKNKQHDKTIRIYPRNLKKKKLYKFISVVEESKWKGKDKVLLFDTLKQVSCEKCSGKGYKTCDHCKGKSYIKCEYCNGTRNIKCKKCDGKGKIEVSYEVIEVSRDGKEKKTTQTVSYVCDECLGSGEKTCSKCSGQGTIVCYECKGLGKIPCNDCLGSGFAYEITEGKVPLEIEEKIVPYTFVTKKDRWMLDDKDIQSKIESAKSFSFQDLNKFTDNEFKDIFGVAKIEKDLKNLIKDTRKKFEDLDKNFKKGKSLERPLLPIELIIILRLHIQSQTGKKCELYALGTKERWTYLVHGF